MGVSLAGVVVAALMPVSTGVWLLILKAIERLYYIILYYIILYYTVLNYILTSLYIYIDVLGSSYSSPSPPSPARLLLPERRDGLTC